MFSLGNPSLLVPRNTKQEPTAVPPETLPEWFAVLESRKKIPLAGNDRKQRWVELFNRISILSREKNSDPEGTGRIDQWGDKEWHDAHASWPHENQRKKGGFWKCRRGLGATTVERACKKCNRKKIRKQREKQEKKLTPVENFRKQFKTAVEEYEFIMKEIEKAMQPGHVRSGEETTGRIEEERRVAGQVLDDLRAGAHFESDFSRR